MIVSNTRVKTPCIGVCSTGIGDIVCRGCKRFAHEVIDWNSYSEEQRQIVVDRLEQFLETIVSNIVDIFDEEKLLQQLRYQQISVNENLSASRWVFELLRTGASQIKSTDEFGFRVKPQWQRYSLEQIKQFMEQDFYTLSCAHYERYIK